jgi:hypothetical protein
VPTYRRDQSGRWVFLSLKIWTAPRRSLRDIIPLRAIMAIRRTRGERWANVIPNSPIRSGAATSVRPFFGRRFRRSLRLVKKLSKCEILHTSRPIR